MDSNTSEKQIKKIVLNRMERCAVCHHSFGPEDIQVLSRRSDMWMMVVTCAECHNRNFVAAVLGDGDAQRAELAFRQLSADAAADPLDAPSGPVTDPVTVDDLLDVHEFLQEFDGDFKALFRAQ